MAGATRVGDRSTGHDACPATPLVNGSPTVLVNGKSAGRRGDSYSSHHCYDDDGYRHPPHQDTISGGSSSVFINGIPAARIGDSVSIGGSVGEGSSNVIIGG